MSTRQPAYPTLLRRPALCSFAVVVMLLAMVFCPGKAWGHVGSKDVFEQITSGPYKFFVTVRPPTVVPGIAVVEVRTAGPALTSLAIAPVPLTGEASQHPPTPDAMQRSAVDPAFFTGSVWLMAPGSWQVRLEAQGEAGPASASVPVTAMALTVQRMQRPLGFLLAVLGLVLVIGMAAIIYGAVRECRLTPGRTPTPARQYRARLAGGATLLFLLLALWGGDAWWNAEAAAYTANVFHPLALHPVLQGDVLDLRIDPGTPDKEGLRRANDDLLPDHGHMMHLYAIRWPAMDAAYHLHPTPAGPGELRQLLPSMLPGTYHLYGDIVHGSGFPETLTASLVIPQDASHNFLDSEDAAAYPAPLSQGALGTNYALPDGYHMLWDRPAVLTANRAEIFRFHLRDARGQPATDMRPYLGMAGHAAFVKTDGTAFAHTHPDGSAAMPAMMLANAGEGSGMSAMMLHDTAVADSNSATNTGMGGIRAERPAVAPEPLAADVDFPYGFPSSGRYRIFVQMKHGDTVETGVFDAEVR